MNTTTIHVDPNLSPEIRLELIAGANNFDPDDLRPENDEDLMFYPLATEEEMSQNRMDLESFFAYLYHPDTLSELGVPMDFDDYTGLVHFPSGPFFLDYIHNFDGWFVFNRLLGGGIIRQNTVEWVSRDILVDFLEGGGEEDEEEEEWEESDNEN